MNTVAGIDFGTSNSSVAYIGDNETSNLIRLEGNSPTIPTALFFKDKTNQIIFGTPAIQSFIDRTPGRFMRSIKRILGSSISTGGTVVNGKFIKFTDIITLFLDELKNRLENELGQAIDTVTMGRPVKFQDEKHEDKLAQEQLLAITKSVGFKNISFQYEPIAAAFAHERDIDGEVLSCVIDIGGGTSDFSIIKIGKKLQNKIDRSQDILANTGIRTGGNDFDKSLGFYGFMPSLGKGTLYGKKNQTVPNGVFLGLSEWSEINFMYADKNIETVHEILSQSHNKTVYSRLLDALEHEHGHELLQIVEQTKIDLTNTPTTTKVLDCIKDIPTVTITSQQFEDYITNHVDKMEKSLNECLIQSQINPTDIKLIILTGGSTEVPLVKSMAKRIFPDAAISDGNKLSSVGTGLAYDAKRRFL